VSMCPRGCAFMLGLAISCPAIFQAFGTELSKEEVEALYRKADTDNSNDVSEEELASYLVGAHKDGELSKVGVAAAS
jgi:uncharacterized protein YehS (DUF1456 family)